MGAGARVGAREPIELFFVSLPWRGTTSRQKCPTSLALSVRDGRGKEEERDREVEEERWRAIANERGDDEAAGRVTSNPLKPNAIFRRCVSSCGLYFYRRPENKFRRCMTFGIGCK